MRRTSRRKASPAALPPVLDLQAAAPLAATLLGRRGGALVVDGSAVERMGAQCLQVLLSARKTWEADGQRFALTAASPAMMEALCIMGASGLAEANGAEASA